VNTGGLCGGEILEMNVLKGERERGWNHRSPKAHAHKNKQIEAQRKKKRESLYVLCLLFS
jgi:hypothetical protein